MTATFRPWNSAGEQRPDLRGRPGINPLGFKTTYKVDAAALEQLQRISRELGLEMGKERARKHFYSEQEIGDDKESEVDLLGPLEFEPGLVADLKDFYHQVAPSGKTLLSRRHLGRREWL